ncbi:uncharacterized protein N7483_009551 [Penicillium malachiteum]|uniref:uncharacterized protein n=1 Tax=Penicillium malachiteum TaxID=1324776 RepID=UPI0025471E9D|nr:uncharacterized protein N7483_009551 [Penicillium malachiteum]KAJ5721617.1 hypothetical protein N7483_009551 [Penicillium malachiteum]
MEPVPKLPQRSATMASNMTRRTSVSDDEAIPDTDSSETSNLLIERLRAWKHLCGNLEDYVSTTARISKSQSKDYEKILKTVSEPLKEAHHFSGSEGGMAGLFQNMRTNSQGMVNMYLETEQNLKGSVLPTLERLHKEVKNKAQELKSGAAKGAKAVEKARQLTQKHIELLGQHSASHDSAMSTKLEQHHDPYILKRQINHRLNKQITEENNHRNDILTVQNSFQQFEAHILQTVQTALEQFHQIMGSQLDRQRAMYADILGTSQRIPPDFEWINFCVSNDAKLVNPDSPPREFANISFPNQDHRSTKPLLEGSLERRSRAMIKGFSSGYYVITSARYLHEFKDDDDFRKDPTPELSLYLPDCIVGAIDGVKFNVKGKDVSNGKVGNAFHTTTELSFKASTASSAEKWWSVIKESTSAGAASAAAAAAPLSTVTSTAPSTLTSPVSPATSTSPASSVSGKKENQPPTYSAEKSASPTTGTADVKPLSRTASSGSYFTGPGGSAAGEKS